MNWDRCRNGCQTLKFCWLLTLKLKLRSRKRNCLFCSTPATFDYWKQIFTVNLIDIVGQNRRCNDGIHLDNIFGNFRYFFLLFNFHIFIFFILVKNFFNLIHITLFLHDVGIYAIPTSVNCIFIILVKSRTQLLDQFAITRFTH